MSKFFYKLIYFTGIFFLNTRIFSHFNFLQESEFWVDEELDELQNCRLRTLLNHAYKTSDYYRKVLDGINIAQVNIKTLDQIPILSKASLLANHEKMYSSLYKKSNLILSETSGSSGDPFVFYRDKQWDGAHRAAIWRGIKQYGVEPYDKNLYLWGFIFTPLLKTKVRILDFLQNRFRIFNFTDTKILTRLKHVKGVIFISGYSSVINKLSEMVVKNGIVFDDLKMIKGTSEKIYGIYQENAEAAFGLPIVSEYGAAETGIISYTCPAGNDHVIRENVIVEVVGGRAVITNLNSFSLPIIRYELGDYIELCNQTCSCGRHSQIVTDIMGRVGRDIVGDNYEYPSLTLYYIFKELALVQSISLSYSGYQSVKGVLDLSIYQPISSEISDVLCDISKRYMPDIKLNIVVDKLEDRSRKIRDFESVL